MLISIPGANSGMQTVLASIVINNLQTRFQHPNTPVIFIYLNHKDSRDQSLLNLVGSLLKQLIQYQAPAAPQERVKRLWEAAKKQDTRPNLDDLLPVFRSVLKSFMKVYIVVDAFDECLEEATRSELLELLQDLCEVNVSLMVTSRPVENKFGSARIDCDDCEMQGLREFYQCTICNGGDFDLCENCVKGGKNCRDESHSLHKLYTCIEIKINAAEADLQKYIEHKVDTEPRLSSICRKDKKLKGRILEKVIEVAGGTFLVANLLMDSLKFKATPKAMTSPTLPVSVSQAEYLST